MKSNFAQSTLCRSCSCFLPPSIHPSISSSIQSFSQCDGCMCKASAMPPLASLRRRTVVTMSAHVCRPPQASVRGGRRGGPAALHPPAAAHLSQEAAAPHEDDVPHQPERGHAPPAHGHRHTDAGENPKPIEREISPLSLAWHRGNLNPNPAGREDASIHLFFHFIPRHR